MNFLCPRPLCRGTLLQEPESLVCILCGRNFNILTEKDINIPKELKKEGYRRVDYKSVVFTRR